MSSQKISSSLRLLIESQISAKVVELEIRVREYEAVLEWYAVRGNNDFGYKAREVLASNGASE